MSKLAPPKPRSKAAARREMLRAFLALRDDLAGTFLVMLGNADDAQDALQETFLKCWRAPDAVRTVRNLRAWIFRVGLNAARDLQRNAWRRRLRPLDHAPTPLDRPANAPAEAAVNREALDRLRLALCGLRPEEREVFLLRQNGALTYEEIAEASGRPVGTVKTQMRAALYKLRRVLGERA
ncbi:MAG TPA: RNA polymerase sigma factor [Gemmataceae bacterium]|nr:RNA polymerase sigma factor [Gemmataceae bacterium]